jgi:hypothetical protein
LRKNAEHNKVEVEIRVGILRLLLLRHRAEQQQSPKLNEQKKKKLKISLEARLCVCEALAEGETAEVLAVLRKTISAYGSGIDSMQGDRVTRKLQRQRRNITLWCFVPKRQVRPFSPLPR